MPSAPTAKAYRGTLPYSICTAAERLTVAGLAHVAQTTADTAVAACVIRGEVDGHAGIHTGVNVGRQQVGMDVGNMHALRLLLAGGGDDPVTLALRAERLTGRAGAIAVIEDRITHLRTVAFPQVLDAVSHRATSCSSCSSVQQK